jgi:pimeloyl-ACP methyl ester carboxylesterase/truncated hemoglobin YjbI
MTTTPTKARVTRSQDGTAIAYETLGAGDGLIVLGGAWRSGRDYLPFARALAQSFEVHVVDRRGRGRSGPQRPNYSIEREVEDLFAVQAHTAATIVFGHSYGGLIALEAARRSRVFSDVVVYEPGVSIAGSIPLGWIARYRALLEAGDRRGAFAAMVRGAGGAPPALERMPLWYVKLMLRLFMNDDQWRRIDPLLEAGLAEHEQVAALDQSTADRYRNVTARVVLLGGGKSRPHLTTTLFEPLMATVANCTTELIAGLDHTAPDEKAPDLVAQRARHHLLARSSGEYDPRHVRTVYEAAGGYEGLLRLANAWHARVMSDEVVGHAFSHGFHRDHTGRLAAYWAEALGGPAMFSDAYGDETAVVRIHSGNGVHEEMDRRAIACFDEALKDAGLADDYRLRQVLHDYFAWATTTTMSRYHRSADDVPDGLAIPQWSWDGLVAGARRFTS